MSGVILKLADEHPHSMPLTQIGAAFQNETTTASAADLPAARRYDEATVQRVLALAMELQTEHRRTLTAEQIVAIGEEASIEPEFVLQAIATLNSSGTMTVSPLSSSEREELTRLRNSSAFLGLRALPRTAKRAATVIPSVYTLLTILQFNSPTFGMEAHKPGLILGNVFVAAPLLALTSGMFLRSKRLGLAAGFFMGVGVLASIAITSDPINLEEMAWGLLAWQALAFGSAGAVLGVTGAILRNDGPRICRRIVDVVTRRS